MDSIWSKLDVEALLSQLVAFIPNLFAAVFIMFTFWLLFRFTRIPVRRLLERAGFHEKLVDMLVGNIYRTTIFVFGLVMAADQVGINVGAALAGIGVAGVAIGFAAQDSLANTIAGFIIFWDKPFEVGEWVTVEGQYGRVSDITMRSTRIRTNNNTYVVIPNRSIIDAVLVNHSKHGETRIDVPVGIAYKESIPEARRVILEAVRGLEGVAASPDPDVVAEELGGSSVNLLVRVWIEDASVEQPVFYRTLEAAKLTLDAAGIQIPYPHLQLFVENVEERVWKDLQRFPALAGSGNGGSQTG